MIKLIFTIPVIICVMFLCSCSNDKPTQAVTKDAVLIIDLENDFNNDSVVVSLNGEVLCTERITTNYILSLAWTTGRVNRKQGKYTIDVQIPDLLVHSRFSLDLHDTMDACIKYSRADKDISCCILNHFFMRD